MGTSSQRVINVGTSSGPLISASEKRKAIIICAPGANRFTLSMDIPAVLDQGLTVYPGDRPTELWYHYHGNMVQKAWQCISAIAAQNVIFWEVYD